MAIAECFLGHRGSEALFLVPRASRHPERKRRQLPTGYCFLRTEPHEAFCGGPSSAPWVSGLGAGARSRGKAAERVWPCALAGVRTFIWEPEAHQARKPEEQMRPARFFLLMKTSAGQDILSASQGRAGVPGLSP